MSTVTLTLAFGFLIAFAVGLTGMGAGSLAVPFFVLVAGLPAAVAVAASLAFSAALRVLAAPLLLARRVIPLRVTVPLLAGGLPGLALGAWGLHRWAASGSNPGLLLVLGVLLIVAAAAALSSRRTPKAARASPLSLALLALPIGAETGFSSAGSGAFGILALLHFSALEPADAVAADLVFSGVLTLAGAFWQMHWTVIPVPLLLHLLACGLPGVMLGVYVSRRLQAIALRRALAAVALTSGAVLAAHAALVLLGH